MYEDLEENRDAWPLVTDVDRMDYLVFRTNFTTKEAMKNYKALEAHNFFTSNFVFPPRPKVLSTERVLLLGKVSGDYVACKCLLFFLVCPEYRFIVSDAFCAGPSFPEAYFRAPETLDPCSEEWEHHHRAL